MACHKQQLTSMNRHGMRLVKMPMAKFDCRKIIKWHISLMFTTLNVHINFVSNMQTKAEIRHFIAYKMIIIILMQNTLSHIIETSCWMSHTNIYLFCKLFSVVKGMNKQT